MPDCMDKVGGMSSLTCLKINHNKLRRYSNNNIIGTHNIAITQSLIYAH
jgi:hypothetical protein